MPKLRVHRKAYKRKSYVRKDGVRVSRAKVPKTTFKIKDRGKKGRTPKAKRFFEPRVKTGWKKGMPASERRRLVLSAHKGDVLASGRSSQALANVTTDRETKSAARADAQHFFRQLR